VGSGLQDVESPQENREPCLKTAGGAAGRAAAGKITAM
jgi:hypothetical protein